MVAFHAAENAYFLRKKEPLFSISDTEPQIPTSYNQQEAATDERGAKRAAEQQQVDLLYVYYYYYYYLYLSRPPFCA